MDSKFSIITKNLQESTENIQTFIVEHREAIKAKIWEAKDNHENLTALHKILQVLDNSKPLYIQYKIPFDLMFEVIGEVFNVALYNFIPQVSLILSLQACFYNAAYLYQLNLLERYVDIIFQPVFHRLTYSCFKSQLSYNNYESIEYMKTNYPQIVNKISSFRNNIDMDVETLAKISLQIDMRNERCLDGLFWLLDETRQFTFEYYLILLAFMFLNTNKCKVLKKMDKISNITMFLKPLYVIMSLYKDFVTNMGIDCALSSTTLESFNSLYNYEISQAIKHLATLLT